MNRLRSGRWTCALLPLVLGCSDPPSDAEPPPEADPGRVTLHRLNRAEYNNTVRDLLGTAARPADEFPWDDVALGFDNNAAALSTSPLQVELYQRAAEALVAEVLRPRTLALKLDADALGTREGVFRRGAALVISTNVEVGKVVTLPGPGRYKLTARAFGDQAGADPVRMTLRLGGAVAGTFTVPGTAPAQFEALADGRGGAQEVAVAFLNDFYDQPNNLDRNLLVEWLAVEGPLDAPASPLRDRVISCDPKTAGQEVCAAEVLRRFARRAWRRPATEDELAALAALAAAPFGEGRSFDEGIGEALTAVLLSPHFLFRVELDPADGQPHRLSDHELAARLSYFLWSSTPDDALGALADAGALGDEATLLAEVGRLLRDPRAEALLANFAAQWIGLRALDNHEPDPAALPAWSEALRQAMKRETLGLAAKLLGAPSAEAGPGGTEGGLDVRQLLLSDFTFVEGRLARHYGLAGVEGDALRRVPLAGSGRRGLLTQGSFLTLSSYPGRTSPTRRGKWVLEQLLCAGPPPPPPGVEGLPSTPGQTGTLRDRLEAHRKDPVCASCHQVMDPIGFGLERFDAIGALRTTDGGAPIDASGQLPSGERFDGAAALAALLGADGRFLRCATEKLFTYALGRGPEDIDRERLAGLTERLGEAGGRLPALIAALVRSEAFRWRRGEPRQDGGAP